MVTGLTRTDDHATSIAAAARIADKLRPLQRMVYMQLAQAGDDGLTDSELRARCDAAYLKRPESTYRKRRSELVAMGIVEPTGQRRNNQSGQPEKAYRVNRHDIQDIQIPKRSRTSRGISYELGILRSALLMVYSDITTRSDLSPTTTERVKSVYAEIFA